MKNFVIAGKCSNFAVGNVNFMKKIISKILGVNLLVQIIIAIGLGILCGEFFPDWLNRLSATFNSIFSQFLGFLIPLLIVGFVAPAIADVGSRAGKMLVLTAALAYAATTCSGLLGYGVGDWLFPHMLTPHNIEELGGGAAAPAAYFTVEMPPLMSVMSSLILAFVLGLCAAYVKVPILKGLMEEFRTIITMTINKIIIPLLPLYIFGIFLSMSVTGEVAGVLSAFIRIIVVIFILQIVILVGQYCIAALFVRRNPFKLLWTMMPAYFTALGTQSSAATIPVTLRQAIKMGVSEDTAGFVIPLCATIHMSGSAMKITACAVALMIMEGMPYTTPMFIGFVCMIGISIIAAPGVPGGAIMASLGILASMLGFSQDNLALMIALYIAMDSFGTACNVTGDGFIALIVDKVSSWWTASKSS